MSYKSDLQQNNTDLQAILADVNALPDAGSGGGGVETCTVHYRFGNDANRHGQTLEFFVTKNGVYHSYAITLTSSTDITCSDQSVSFETDKYGTKHPVFEVDKGTAILIKDPTLEIGDVNEYLCTNGCQVQKIISNVIFLVVVENDECILGWSWNI